MLPLIRPISPDAVGSRRSRGKPPLRSAILFARARILSERVRNRARNNRRKTRARDGLRTNLVGAGARVRPAFVIFPGAPASAQTCDKTSSGVAKAGHR